MLGQRRRRWTNIEPTMATLDHHWINNGSMSLLGRVRQVDLVSCWLSGRQSGSRPRSPCLLIDRTHWWAGGDRNSDKGADARKPKRRHHMWNVIWWDILLWLYVTRSHTTAHEFKFQTAFWLARSTHAFFSPLYSPVLGSATLETSVVYPSGGKNSTPASIVFKFVTPSGAMRVGD